MMRRRSLLGLPFAAATAWGQRDNRAGAALDMMYEALEQISAEPSPSQIDRALSLLKGAIELDSGLADAHYYRSLLLERKKDRRSTGSLDEARQLGSKALAEKQNPFQLASLGKFSSGAGGLVRNKWAVLVGISRFNDPQSGAKLQLNYAHKDAEDLKKALTDPQVGRFPQDNVVSLINEQATLVGIRRELNRVSRLAQPEDLVVIFLSSHGTPRRADLAELNYIVAHDTRLKDDYLYATALPMVEVSDIVRTRMTARRVAVFLDTCHSGGAARTEQFRGASLGGQAMKRFAEGEGRVIMTSSNEQETSMEADRWKNGVFTSCLLDGLKQSNGCQPIRGLFQFVRNEVGRRVKEMDPAATQTPTLHASDRAPDFSLGVAPGNTACA